MLIDTFANRLKQAMNLNYLNQSQLVTKTGLDKSLISNYLSGNYKAKQDNLSILAEALNVSETWLMGYDVPLNNDSKEGKTFDEIEVLFNKNKDILTTDDREMIKFMIEKRKKEIDKQLGEE